MKLDKELMIDIETLATTPNAAVLSIAAIRFNMKKNYQNVKSPEELDVFYKKISLESQPNREINDDVLLWWSKQKQQLVEDTFSADNRVDLKSAIMEFNQWASGSNRYWSKGSIFDFPILESCNKQFNLANPWQYYEVHDARTVFNLVPDIVMKNPQAHNALYDCFYQILQLQKILQKLGL